MLTAEPTRAGTATLVFTPSTSRERLASDPTATESTPLRVVPASMAPPVTLTPASKSRVSPKTPKVELGITPMANRSVADVFCQNGAPGAVTEAVESAGDAAGAPQEAWGSAAARPTRAEAT